MPRNRRFRSGFSLVEVLVAIVLLAIGGTALVELLGQTAASMRTTRNSERLIRRSSAVLNEYMLLTREDLMRLSGSAVSEGNLRVDISRRSSDLFDVLIAETDTSPTVLRTTFYRPISDSNAVP